MKVRTATPDDAAAVAAIYGPVVQHTTISFEVDPPDAAEMRARIEETLATLPWLVAEDAAGTVCGYVYASKHKERAAYQWSVDTTVYVRDDMRGQGRPGAVRPPTAAAGRVGLLPSLCRGRTAECWRRGLHEALGFQPIGVYRNVGFKHGAWRDVGWWQRSLRETEAPPGPPAVFDSRS
jgi:phosphinothricin acetyltransferase